MAAKPITKTRRGPKDEASRSRTRGARAGSRRAAIEQALQHARWPESSVVRNYELTYQSPRSGKRTGHHGAKHSLVAYVLEAAPGTPTATVAVVGVNHDPLTSLHRAIRQAQMLDVPLVYVTNGAQIIEHSTRTGHRREVEAFATPTRAWAAYLKLHGLTRQQGDLLAHPFDPSLSNGPDDTLRYYQVVAANRVVAAAAKGETKALVVMAPGAGRTTVALQVAAKLKAAKGTDGKPFRALYLADRDVTFTAELRDKFVPAFGTKERNSKSTTPPIMFATAAELTTLGDAYKSFPKDYFDLIVVDECIATGSDRANWLDLLDYFKGAFKLGLTFSTRDDASGAYRYFGNPVYLYTSAQAELDGFALPEALPGAAKAKVRGTERERVTYRGGAKETGPTWTIRAQFRSGPSRPNQVTVVLPSHRDGSQGDGEVGLADLLTQAGLGETATVQDFLDGAWQLSEAERAEVAHRVRAAREYAALETEGRALASQLLSLYELGGNVGDTVVVGPATLTELEILAELSDSLGRDALAQHVGLLQQWLSTAR